MTKGEFIDEIANRTGLSKKDAGAAVDAVLGTISDTLKGGGDVAFTGFGKFHVTKRSARTGVNPRNPGQKVQIPAATVPKFSAGSRSRRQSGLAGGRQSAEVASARRANMCSHGRPDATSSRASPCAAPARAGRGRPARGADRGDRRATRSRARRRRAARAPARPRRTRAARARGGRRRRRAPRAPSRRARRPRRPRAAGDDAAGRRRLDGRRPRDHRASARAPASSRSERSGSRASSRWRRCHGSSTPASRCRRGSAS